MLRKLLTEFIGTFFLVMTIVLAVNTKSEVAVLAIGFVLMVMVYMGGHVSGAHYNPAISTALLVAKKLPAGDYVPYVLAQIVGGLAGSYTGYAVAGAGVGIAAPREVNLTTAAMLEALFTFALAIVVLNVACSKKTTGNWMYGLAIGGTIVAAAFAAGPYSGGAFNPAVGIALTATGTDVGASWRDIWVYILGPVVGAVIAAVVFRIQEEAGDSAT
jgi:aquaporin Z